MTVNHKSPPTGIPRFRLSAGRSNLAFKVVPARNALCEEPNAQISLRYVGPNSYQRDLSPTFVDGALVDHRLESIRWNGHFRKLPAEPTSAEAFAAACAKAARDTSKWQFAASADEFVYSEARMTALYRALRDLPDAAFQCVDIDKKPCTLSRVELQRLIRKQPPDYSQELLIPDEGNTSVYRYSDPDPMVGTDYDATVRLDRYNMPQSARIRFRREARPIP